MTNFKKMVILLLVLFLLPFIYWSVFHYIAYLFPEIETAAHHFSTFLLFFFAWFGISEKPIKKEPAEDDGGYF